MAGTRDCIGTKLRSACTYGAYNTVCSWRNSCMTHFGLILPTSDSQYYTTHATWENQSEFDGGNIQMRIVVSQFSLKSFPPFCTCAHSILEQNHKMWVQVMSQVYQWDGHGPRKHSGATSKGVGQSSLNHSTLVCVCVCVVWERESYHPGLPISSQRLWPHELRQRYRSLPLSPPPACYSPSACGTDQWVYSSICVKNVCKPFGALETCVHIYYARHPPIRVSTILHFM